MTSEKVGKSEPNHSSFFESEAWMFRANGFVARYIPISGQWAAPCALPRLENYVGVQSMLRGEPVAFNGLKWPGHFNHLWIGRHVVFSTCCLVQIITVLLRINACKVLWIIQYISRICSEQSIVRGWKKKPTCVWVWRDLLWLSVEKKNWIATLTVRVQPSLTDCLDPECSKPQKTSIAWQQSSGLCF